VNTRTLAADVKARMAPSNLTVDAASVIGLVCGFGLLIAAIVLGGSPGSFFNFPSVLIVLGGTFSVVTICFSISEVVNTFRVVVTAVLPSVRAPEDAAQQALRIAELARRNGVLALQNIQRDLAAEPFLHKCVSMVIDGAPAEEVEAVMRRDLQATTQRHGRSADVLRKAAEFAPAMGLIGTLVGLVQMLGNLDDPAAIGPSMAVALLTTFYGAVLANMVFSPLAAKLERNSADETLVNLVYVMGAVSIVRQENPRRLEMLINSVLPPSGQVRYFD
jgi:chemotaxis protein MotA